MSKTPLDAYDPFALRFGTRYADVCERFRDILNADRIERGGWKLKPGYGCLLVWTEQGHGPYRVTDTTCTCPARCECRHLRCVRQGNGFAALLSGAQWWEERRCDNTAN